MVTADAWSFRCSACGRCCNSSPQLSVPELFRHQHIFVGSLAIRRVRRLQPGERHFGITADAGDCAASSELAERLLHRTEESTRGGYDFLLTMQGFDSPSSTRCPALGEARGCTIHRDRKPATCSAVPLEALAPDRLQRLVLAGRRSSGDLPGSECIVSGERRGFSVVTRGAAVTDAAMREALARRRADLTAEKRWWGDAVFGILRKELFDDAAAAGRIPFDGFLALAAAPVLMVLAEVSESCRGRCLEYLDAQAGLIEARIAGAELRSGHAGPEIRQLHAFLRTGDALRRALRASPARRGTAHAAGIEAWLGLDLTGNPQPPSPRREENGEEPTYGLQ
jgi:Fe-S-cluster containining protein